MSTIVNARDVLLQAAATRLGSVSLPVNVVVPNAQVAGLGDLALQDAVNLATQITGALANSNVSGLGALALLGAVNLGDATVVGDLAATRIGVGTLAAGVIYAGTLSASNVTAGTLTGVTIAIGSGHGTGGYAFVVGSGGVVEIDNLFAGFVQGNNFYYSVPAIDGITQNQNQPGVRGLCHSSNSNSGAHGVRGQSAYTGAAGLVGGANSYDFYADGSGTNYGPFTGTHDAVIPNGATAEPGHIVVDVACIERKDWSGTLFEVELSSTPNQLGAIGVVCASGRPLSEVSPSAFIDHFNEDDLPVMKASYETYKDAYTALAINAVGEGQLLCTDEGGDLAVGDLIVTSSTPGVGMKQADDVIRNYTVAKCREAVSFTAGEVKAVACIYLCG